VMASINQSIPPSMPHFSQAVCLPSFGSMSEYFRQCRFIPEVREPELSRPPANALNDTRTLVITSSLMGADKKQVFFYCVPDIEKVQSHFWDGASGLLCRPPKGTASIERACCQRHRDEAKKNATQENLKRAARNLSRERRRVYWPR
jgi:hypothetical protein